MVTAGDEHDDSSVDLRSTKRSRNDGQVTSAQQHMPHDSDEEESRHEDGLENNVKPFDADDDSDDDAGDDDHGDPIDDDETAALKADLGDDVREGKRVRRTGADQSSTGPSHTSAQAGPSTESNDLWRSMKETQDVDSSRAAQRVEDGPQEEMVRITHTFRFGREDVTEEKMLPASHPEAKAFLAKQARKPASTARAAPSAPPASLGGHAGGSDTSTSKPEAPAQRQAPPLGPRRRKGGSLAAMSAAATAKPSKINTLEKSKMDWTQFKSSSLDEHARHELDAQTKGGSSGLSSVKGYMDRKDFLDRVQDRLGEGGRGGKG